MAAARPLSGAKLLLFDEPRPDVGDQWDLCPLTPHISLSTQHLQLPKTHCRISPEKRGFCSSAKSLFGSPASSCHGLSQWVSPSNFELALSLFCSVRRLPFMFSNYWAFSQCRLNFLWCHHQSEGWGHPISNLVQILAYILAQQLGGIHRLRNVSFQWNLWNVQSQWIDKRLLNGSGLVNSEQFTLPAKCPSLILSRFHLFHLPFDQLKNFFSESWNKDLNNFWYFCSSRADLKARNSLALPYLSALASILGVFWAKFFSVVSANRQNDEYDIHSDLAPDNFTSHTLTMDN